MTPTTPTTPKSEKPYHETDHFHCWGQPKTPACGKPSEAHDVCCLCGIPKVPAPQHTSPEKELASGWTKILARAEETATNPSFTDTALAEYDSMFDWAEQIEAKESLRWELMYGFTPKKLREWLVSTLEEAQREHDECAAELVDLADERFTEGKKSGIQAERNRILTLIESKFSDKRGIEAHNLLTSLAEELKGVSLRRMRIERCNEGYNIKIYDLDGKLRPLSDYFFLKEGGSLELNYYV